MDLSQQTLSPLADALIKEFEKKEFQHLEDRMKVNPLVAKFASWYEKIRTAMDYREEEVVLRSAIERILKRRLILGGTGKTIAEPIIRELVWARYILDYYLSEPIIKKVEEEIDAYLFLKSQVVQKYTIKEGEVNEWIIQLLSSSLEYILNPNIEKEVMANFMFQILKKHIVIADDTEQNKDVQAFIAVRKSFAKDDIALLRYHLFTQYFGKVTKDSVREVADSFKKGYDEIQSQLQYPRKDRIFTFARSKSAIFFILEDVLRAHKGKIGELIKDQEELKKTIFSACQVRYNSIASKVRRAIMRSVVFIILTKAFFAFSVEGSIENMLYGKVMWNSILLNIAIPPLIMIIISFFIRTPGRDNSQRIFSYIQTLLFDPRPSLGEPLRIQKNPEKNNLIEAVFTLLWFVAFLVAFGLLVFILTKLHFRWISQGIFIFFFTIISFLSYRIYLMSKTYTVEDRPGIFAPIIDFLLMPIVRIGRHLTEGISQINVLLFIFDFIIEAPFKGISAFIEQWFFFLHAKREELE